MLTGIEQGIVGLSVFCDGLIGQVLQLVHLTVQTVNFGDVQHPTRQTQPCLNSLDAWQLLGQVFRLLLVAVQTQCDGFIRQQARQPAAQLCSTLTIATGGATVHGPAAVHQPARRVERELAPARVFEFFKELLRCGFAHVFVVLTDLHQWAPVFQQCVEGGAQRVGGLAWRGLAEAADQGAQVDQLLHPILQQTPVAIETVLLGQTLAAGQQVPGQGGKGVVQWRFGCQLRGWQVD